MVLEMVSDGWDHASLRQRGDRDLEGVAGRNGTHIAIRTGAVAWTQRTIRKHSAETPSASPRRYTAGTQQFSCHGAPLQGLCVSGRRVKQEDDGLIGMLTVVAEPGRNRVVTGTM